MKRRPTPPPLTKTERAALDHLVRRGAAALNPSDGNHLVRLWELDQADRRQERRTAGGTERANHELKSQLTQTSAEAGRYRAAWQSARRRAAHTTAALDAVLELPVVQAYMATLTYDDAPDLVHQAYEGPGGGS